eukprot:scaffold156765_cov51-Prasinocladus_malaysianus.AAC.1
MQGANGLSSLLSMGKMKPTTGPRLALAISPEASSPSYMTIGESQPHTPMLFLTFHELGIVVHGRWRSGESQGQGVEITDGDKAAAAAAVHVADTGGMVDTSANA